MLKFKWSVLVLFNAVLFCHNGLAQAAFTYSYDGDKTPAEEPYGSLYTTLGPGHPTGAYFVGTEWSSNGDVLTMHTVNPNDYPGATSLGIWFGRTDGYGDPSSFSLASTTTGNRVDLRSALAPNSGEWSLYWYDASGYGCGFYFLDNGFQYGMASGSFFVPVADMTAFHTFSSQIYNGQVVFYFDGAVLNEGPAIPSISNFLLVGDGSAGTVTGYGSFLIDYLNITVDAGPAPLPEPASLSMLGMAGILILRRRKN